MTDYDVVLKALQNAGIDVISDSAGRAIPTLVPESKVHAAFLARDDIASLPMVEQAAQWEDQKEAIARFYDALSGVPLFGASINAPGASRLPLG